MIWLLRLSVKCRTTAKLRIKVSHDRILFPVSVDAHLHVDSYKV